MHFIRIFKFSLSSFTAFLVDYAVYSLVLLLFTDKISFGTLTFANIVARIVSSTLNFTINRNFVFKSTDNVFKSAVKYFSLAALVLLGNSLVLNFFTHCLNINHYISKILTEMLFFLFNFTIQNFIIFKKK